MNDQTCHEGYVLKEIVPASELGDAYVTLLDERSSRFSPPYMTAGGSIAVAPNPPGEITIVGLPVDNLRQMVGHIGYPVAVVLDVATGRPCRLEPR